MKRLLITRIVAVLAAPVVISDCGPPPAPNEIRFGLLWVQEGPAAGISGQSSVQGARLAVREINARGGITIDGEQRRVQLIERGYENRPDAAASAATALVNLDSVHVLIGPQLSTHAVSASSVAENARVPMISPMSSNPLTTAGKRFVFRLAYLDAFQGAMLARYAWDDLGARRAAALFDASNPYSRDVAALFQQTFEDLGGKVVSAETFTADQLSDFTAQLRRIAAARPDVLLLPNYAMFDTVQIRQARKVGVRARFLGSDAWDPPGMAKVPEAAGAVVARQWHEAMPLPQVAAFIDRYRKFAKETPRATAALTYDAVMLTAAAMERAASTDGDTVATTIAHWGAFEGASGAMKFTGSGDPVRSGILDLIQRRSDSLLKVVPPSQ